MPSRSSSVPSRPRCCRTSKRASPSEARKSIELDALVASVCELGVMTGVPTLFTDALFGLARLHARSLDLYPA